MIWKIRHQGSPESLEGLTAEQIVEGVQEGQWEPTDEVRGPDEDDWTTLETHPHFAEAMNQIEPPFAPPHPDETRLDMNPLIDVALVLLIFFILTTTYQELRKMFPAPESNPDPEKKQTIGEGQLRELTIRVVAKKQTSASTMILIEDEPVAERDLQVKFEELVTKTGRNRLAVEIEPGVPWKTFMAIQDAAAGAKIEETIRIERKREEKED